MEIDDDLGVAIVFDEQKNEEEKGMQSETSLMMKERAEMPRLRT